MQTSQNNALEPNLVFASRIVCSFMLGLCITLILRKWEPAKLLLPPSELREAVSDLMNQIGFWGSFWAGMQKIKRFRYLVGLCLLSFMFIAGWIKFIATSVAALAVPGKKVSLR